MGNDPSQPESLVDNETARARQQQLQELQDISSNYLDHLELIVDSRDQMEDPRDVIMVLKANLKTAREEIEKISTKRIINIQQQNYTNNNNNNTNNSPIPNGNKKTHTSSNDSPLSKSQRLLLQPTDSDSHSVGSSYISKFPSTNNRFVYDWCNASIEQIYFDQCNLGKINSICIATSTYDPLIMATVSQDGKCRIWKLRQKSKHYEILKSNRTTNQIELFDSHFNTFSPRTESIEHINDNKKRNSKKSKNSNKKDRKRSGNKSRKNSHKTSVETDITDMDIYSSLGSDGINANNGKIPRKELRFELCHEIKLSSTWNMCVSIHHKGNLVAIGGLDTNVTIFDITPFNVNDNNNMNSEFPDIGSKPSSPRAAKHKKQKSISIFSSNKKKSIDKEMERIIKSEPNTPIIFKENVNAITDFEVNDSEIKMCELTFWDEYISCIKFMNDNYHIIVGSGDGTVTICNYITNDKINSWKCKSDVISVDYLYLENDWNINNKSKSLLSSESGSASLKKEEKKKKKGSKKWKFGKKNKDKNKVYIDDELADSDSDCMSSNALHKMYDTNPQNIRRIMVLIGTANESLNSNNIFIDEYNLIVADETDKSMDIATIKKVHLVQYKEKIIAGNGNNMKYSFCLDNKKCECVKYSPNGKYFAVGGESGKYEIYNRNTMKLVHERYTKDERDKIVLQRRPNLKTLNALNENENENECLDDESAITCITWINNNSVAIGNIKGEFIYISTILHEWKIRNVILKEYINVISNSNDLDNIIQEIHEFIGCDVIDNVIEVNFGHRISCLTSHPYFEMKPLMINASNSIYNMYNDKKQGLCVSGSWSKVFQGCVLKG